MLHKPFHFFIGCTAVLLLAAAVSSCKKILEQVPKNSTYLEVYWKSARDCESAIAGNYSLLRAALTDASSYDGSAYKYYMYGDAETSNQTYFNMNYNGDGLEGIQGGDFTFQYNLQTLGNWTQFYKVIAMSNTILKQVPLIDNELLTKDVSDVEEYKNKIMGQALFIRAYAYFMLTRVYGDVPLVTEAYDDPLTAPQLPRSDRALVMKQIEDDCHQAAAMLNWGYESLAERAVTANRGSVYALLTHLYLWRGTMSNLTATEPDMNDVYNADTTLQTLLSSGGYMLQDTAKYGQQFIGRSSESIFELNMSENTQEGAYSHIGMEFLTGNYINGFGNTPRCQVTDGYFSKHYNKPQTGYGYNYYWNGSDYEWIELKVVGDRYYRQVNGTGAFTEDVTDGVYYTGGYAYVYNPAIDDYDYLMVGGFGKDAGDVRFRNNFDGTICKKYSNVTYRNPAQQTSPYLSNNMVLFRLSDMKLLQAEIALYQNNTVKAHDILLDWQIRNNVDSLIRVKSDDDKETLMYKYMVERGKEFYLEGQLYWDLMRTRMYTEFIPWLSTARFQAGGFYWPIDPVLFKDNRLLTQTSYWRGKV